MIDFSLFYEEFKIKYPNSPGVFDESLREHTTFRIGGRARLWLAPESAEAMQTAAGELRRRGLPFLVVGNGSNLLFSDKDHELAVISTEGLRELTITGDRIRCGAGVPLGRLARAAMEASLTGLEFAHGIPGTLGGAVYMNAGAYGGEMRDVVESVTFLDEQGEIREMPASECGFAYRRSVFEEGGIVLGAALRLRPGNKAEIRAAMDELMRRRKEKQPVGVPSAGSTFKRPATGYAAQMIEEAGLKGARVGDAQVSEKHAGFIVNLGNAAFEDVTGLMELVQRTVFEKFGVTLEPEVKIIR